MRDHRSRVILVGLVLGLALTACTGGASGSHSTGVTQSTGAARGAGQLAHWIRFRHIPGILDLANRDRRGSLFVAADGRLFILGPGGTLTPYARGRGGYITARGPEPYIAVAGDERVAGTNCSFGAGTIYTLQPTGRPGIIMVGSDGRARRFATVPKPGLLTGITFDGTGHFGHDLLVTHRASSGVTTVLAFDCNGHVRTITRSAPALEGGLTVAPTSFGRYAGDLIAPDERTGRVFAIQPDGMVLRLAISGLPHGGDVGVESEGFVPPGFGAGLAAYLADRFSPGNRHPGTDSLLRLPGSALVKAGVRAGDLLVATEASAKTVLVRCARVCTVRYIALGPAISHAEGHIIFAPLSRHRRLVAGVGAPR